MAMDLYIEGLSKTFGSTAALHPTNLSVKAGTFTTLLGPSGCGKTTLLRMIAGLETPDTGTISIGGDSLFDASRKRSVPAHKRGFGMVFQDFALWPHMTVFENVAFGLRTSRRTQDLQGTVTRALDKVQLGAMKDRYPHQLSGGQQQRVAFARAVAVEPKLVLFDEPLSALDAALREEMRVEMLSLVRDLGLTALYVTHDQIEAMSMSDEIVVMQGGRVLQRGTPEEIYAKPSDPFVARFIGRSNWIAPSSAPADAAQAAADPDSTLDSNPDSNSLRPEPPGTLAMFRPEHLRWEPLGEGNCDAYEVEILQSSYMGDRYEVHVQADGQPERWTAYHDCRIPAGSRMTVYLPRKKLHRLNIVPHA
ncbi:MULTISPECIES: ABC transporter ATP-binding protein [Saccharibacillus]|uniref:ABC transporter ATP-binding protein n=1 Tax=Saccharibacillus TaxID=456492 RepID=UPI0012388AE6|nr:ABC transporter ATP-binding protein [Saccharibacillus sp. WB 17]MWJ30414.1 ATP-binding cassette domain-containing protein [Saccharibacillus sp. WB 17]